MVDVIKLKGTEISIATANTVANATLIRVYNTAAADGVLTIANTGGSTQANCTIATKTAIYIRKNPTDTANGASMLAVPVSF